MQKERGLGDTKNDVLKFNRTKDSHNQKHFTTTSILSKHAEIGKEKKSKKLDSIGLYILHVFSSISEAYSK